MTRPKVPEDKRQRTAQACDMCKRRKQKCNGEQPCQACGKRQSRCKYGSRSPVHESPPQTAFSPPKRGPSPTAPTSGPERVIKKPALELDLVSTDVANGKPLKQGNVDLLKPPVLAKTAKKASSQDNETQYSATSGAEDEAEVYTETRMLQAPDGRPIYLGDSAPLSGLQLFRAIVENAFGQCDFTTDPSRHKIMENIVELPQNHELPGVFPPLPASSTLLEAFFINTYGLVDIFNRADFEKAVVASLNEPFIAKPKLLCLMYLTFAIGLILATPKQGSKEEEIIRSLRQSGFDVAENFFRNTRRLVDPLTIQENADFWSVQILCLMSIYMLSISRRNAAYSYLGMAVQSAFTLGLHRGKETHVIFPPDEQAVRRNVWRSLFVLDRFLAAALGRPPMITEEDCSDDSLDVPGESLVPAPRITSSVSVSVEIAKVVGRILQKIYSTRRVSVRLGQQFAADCGRLETLLREELHWKRAMDPATPPTQAMSILHLNLFYGHAVVLYTRPFFLFLLKKDQVDGIPPAQFNSRIQRFSRTCVTTSEHTVGLVHGAFAARYLPRRNPFVIHFLFATSLIILGNEFAGLHPNPEYHTQISKILAVMLYCAKTDPQADRLIYILRTFNDVVIRRRQHQSESDPSKALAYSLSPEEMQRAGRSISTVTGRKPSDGAISDVSQQQTSITSTGSAIPAINTRVGTYPGILSMPPETTFQGGTLNGTSPVSTNSYSQPTADGMSGRRTSDGHTPAGEDEVYLEQLWRGPHCDAVAGVPLFQSLSDVPKTDGRDMGSFGVYSIFMRGTEGGAEGASGSGVPLFLQSLLNPDISG